jgi:hypothetical protein
VKADPAFAPGQEPSALEGWKVAAETTGKLAGAILGPPIAVGVTMAAGAAAAPAAAAAALGIARTCVVCANFLGLHPGIDRVIMTRPTIQISRNAEIGDRIREASEAAQRARVLQR